MFFSPSEDVHVSNPTSLRGAWNSTRENITWQLKCLWDFTLKQSKTKRRPGEHTRMCLHALWLAWVAPALVNEACGIVRCPDHCLWPAAVLSTPLARKYSVVCLWAAFSVFLNQAWSRHPRGWCYKPQLTA